MGYPATKFVLSSDTDIVLEVSEEYFTYREKGMACEYPVKYQVGRDYRLECIGSVNDKGELVDYIDARKKFT